jgi:lauroyl/myristoyl acyltransferase
MSLSKYIQTALMPEIRSISSGDLQQRVLDLGRKWFSDNHEESALIVTNCQKLGVDVTDERIQAIKDNILLHYYEKLLPFTGTLDSYYDFIKTMIDGEETVEKLKASISKGAGVLLASAHFGAIEFTVPYLATHFLPMNVLMKFSTEALSKTAHDMANRFFENGHFGQIKFIELGKPGTSAAMDMAAVLRKKEILLTVFDEKTDYSIPVKLFGKKVWGGAGLHKIITYTARNIALYSIFMIRQKDGRYKLSANEINAESPDAMQQIYQTLESVLSQHFEQWYFLHEDLPFVEETE